MQSLWRDDQAPDQTNLLEQRVYSSRLLGKNPDLVLHGGGNTSVKMKIIDTFQQLIDVLYVKGSGWDLSTIEAAGFAPVKLDILLQMAEFEALSDVDMVKMQRLGLLDPNAPNPSVEAILHAIIPFTFVDHTHADAIVTLTKLSNTEAVFKSLYQDRLLYIPYVMPGFELARYVYLATKTIDWQNIDGIVLHQHGLFTFANQAKESYEKTIDIVSVAEQFLPELKPFTAQSIMIDRVIQLRSALVQVLNQPIFVQTIIEPYSLQLAQQQQPPYYLDQISPLTPDHILRTKQKPLLLAKSFSEDEIEAALINYIEQYQLYFKTFASNEQHMLDPVPRYVIWQGVGTFVINRQYKALAVVADIIEHTAKAYLQANMVNEYIPLDDQSLFAVEYWSLEQAKLGKNKTLSLAGLTVAITQDQDELMILTMEKYLSLLGAQCHRIATSIDIEEMIHELGGVDVLMITPSPESPEFSEDLLYALAQGFQPKYIQINHGLTTIISSDLGIEQYAINIKNTQHFEPLLKLIESILLETFTLGPMRQFQL